MTKPNFLVIGAKKCGTTSLSHYLDEHPQVFMSPVKEPNFFAYKGGRVISNHPKGLPIPVVLAKTRQDVYKLIEKKVDVATFTTERAYEALFEGAGDHRAIGEASHSSLYFPEAAGRIHDYMPDGKLIALLRNPVDRAYSDYLMIKRDGREPIDDFFEAFLAEDNRIRMNYDSAYHYKSFGFYYSQLQRFYRLFPSDQIKVILSDDLFNRPQETMKSIYLFLGVDDSFCPEIEKIHGIGGIPQTRVQKWLYQFAIKPSKIKSIFLRMLPGNTQNAIMKLLLGKPGLDPETRSKLIEVYRPDIEKLQELIQRDLSLWLR